jgi:ADP-ribosylglycohydrolase
MPTRDHPPASVPPDHLARMRRARASLDGLSVGDAFGQRFRGSTTNVETLISRAIPRAPWDTTDDTEMGIAVAEILDRFGAINQDALADRFAQRYAADPRRGYGGVAHGILRAIGEGLPWRDVATEPFEGMGSMGNGAAMRVGPVGAYFADDLERVVGQARASAEITHAHPEGQAGAIAVAIAAAMAWQTRKQPNPNLLLQTVLRYMPHGETSEGIAQALALPANASIATAVRVLGNGAYVTAPDTVPFALWCATRHPHDYVETMWRTVSGLGDCDTTCAIAGSIVVLSAGQKSIPDEWLAARESLTHREPDSYHMTLVTGSSVRPPKE